jgi:hypothetical protein
MNLKLSAATVAPWNVGVFSIKAPLMTNPLDANAPFTNTGFRLIYRQISCS